MASAIVQVLDAVVAACPAGWTKTDENGHAIVGSERLAVQGDAPRLVWVPQPEPLTPLQARRSEAQGALWLRRATLAAHLWGADVDAIDDPATGMIVRLVAALQDTLSKGNYQITGSARWIWGDDIDVRGVLYVLPVELQIPIPRVAMQTATVETIPVTSQIVNPADETDVESGPSFTLT